jgi:hypothetical protein
MRRACGGGCFVVSVPLPVAAHGGWARSRPKHFTTNPNLKPETRNKKVKLITIYYDGNLQFQKNGLQVLY